LVIKTPGSGSEFFGHQNPWIRISIQPKMLDPDPHQMNTDPQHWILADLSVALLEEVALCVLEQEALVPGLAAGAGVEEMLQRHGALCGADHPDFPPLRPAHPVGKLCNHTKSGSQS
jgi:hypothetical protein